MVEIKAGEVGEGYPWEYHAPYKSETYSHDLGIASSAPCPHASFLGDAVAKTRSDGSVYGYERAYEIPEAAVCFNEAHHNCTILCLSCVDDARAAQRTGAPTSE